MTSFRPLLALLALLLAMLPARAQDYPEGRPYLHAIGTRDGLPQTSVMSLSMDAKGFLWVGTADGAAYSDGTAWTQVAIPDKARSNYVQAILHASDGSTWFARQDGGVARLGGGSWTSFNTSNGFPQDRVNALAETRDGDGSVRIWAGLHGEGLACYHGGTWTLLGPREGLPDGRVWCLRPALGGSALWIGTDNGGLARWEAGRLTRLPGLPPASVNSLVERRAPGGGTELFVGTYGFGVAERTETGWRFFTTRDGLPSDFVTDLGGLVDPTGTETLWATTLNGLARYRLGHWTAFTRRNGLPTSTLYRVLPSRSPEGRGRIWIGSGGAGLLRLDLGGWKTLDIQDGMEDDNVWCEAETWGRDGLPMLWVGTSKGLLTWHRGRWSHVAGRERVMCLAVDGGGAVWAGTLAGLYRVAPDGRVDHFDTRTELPNNRVSCALATRGAEGGGRLWFGTEGGGLVCHEKGAWRVVDTRNGLPYPTINCLLETEDRTFGRVLWVGLRSQGLAGLRPDGSWIRFTMADGLPNENITALQEIRTSSGGRELWAGTFGKGAARLPLDRPAPRWAPVVVTDQPRQDVIQGIHQDRAGYVYLYSLHGILRLDHASPSAPAPPRAILFGGEDGLPSEQINPRAGFVDRRGWLWAGTTSGLAVLNPAAVIPDATPKPLRLSATLAGPGAPPLAPGASLSHREGDPLFRFTLIDFFKTGEHRYRSQLEGLEDEATPWGPGTSREFTHLPYGTYTFKVWGCDASGNISGPEAFRFRVRPAPWRTPWFLALAAAALAGLIVTGGRWRERRLRQRNEELRALVLARTQDLLRTNQDLRREVKEREAAERAKGDFVSAVSHELRTPLTSIRGSLGMLAGGVLGSLPEPAHNLVDMAQRNTLKLLSLVNDLLDHQKIEAGRMELVLAPLELGGFLQQAVEDHAGYAADFQVTCRLYRPTGGVWVLGDPQRLHQVLANLLSNATKYATRERIVKVDLSTREHWARIAVTNHGEPIPEPFRPRIFHPFEQADQGDARTARGTGLGLHISKAIVELHHGHIGYESTEAATTFHVELPLIDGPAKG